MAEDPKPPAEIGTRTCLFLDDRYIAGKSGLERAWHQGQPFTEPAIAPQKPWELWPHLFGSVLYDPADQRYKMWYESLNGYKPGTLETLILYAESRDGRNWTRPELGLHELNGSKANNVVLPKAELANVFIDPNEQDLQSRYKMLVWDNSLGVPHGRYRIFRSADGKKWTAVIEGPPESLVDPAERIAGVRSDTNLVMWDELAKRYYSTYRTYPKHALGFHENRRRAIGVTTSSYLQTGWTGVTTVLRADDVDDAKVARLSRGPQPDWAELYVMPAFTYGNHYIGLVSLLYFVDGKDTTVGAGDLQLAFSHDGFAWHRPSERKTLVAPSATPELVPVYAACSPPLEMEGELWMYYSEANSAHPAADPKSLIRIARWRKDGFASLKASGAEPGALTTFPLKVTGKKLKLNYAAPAGFELRVALLDAKDVPLKGFEAEACDPLTGDSTGREVTWRGSGDLGSLKDEAVRLKITMPKGEIYSFRFEGP